MSTLGEKRVRTEFNPSKTDKVDFIKQETTKLINYLEDEVKGSVHVPSGIPMGESVRLKKLAQTSYEQAGMWAVKALTIKE